MFSTSEEKLLKFISKSPISITELTSKFYDGNPPFEGSKRIANMVNRIESKLERSNEDWELVSAGGGRGGKYVWIEKKGSKRSPRS